MTAMKSFLFLSCMEDGVPEAFRRQERASSKLADTLLNPTLLNSLKAELISILKIIDGVSHYVEIVSYSEGRSRI